MRPPHLASLAPALALLVLAACASPREAACARWAQTWCQRLWQCTVEHARSNPAFVARYGDSLPACQAIEAPACLEVEPCVPGPEAEACRAAAAAAACTELGPVCAPACG